MTRRNRLAAPLRLEVLEARTVLSSYSPAQLMSAYGLDQVTFSATGRSIQGDGRGQTIAIIAINHDANIGQELQTFDAQYGLANPALAVNNMAGSTSNPIWAEEETLDVEWAHAAAPGANIMVEEAASVNINDLLGAINAARNTAGVSVVSMSFGSVEFPSETSYDSVFTTPGGHTGITFLASSGDGGAATQWPAASPNVVSVGGTSLSIDASGGRGSESAWSGSGGGYSQYETEPAYQRSVQSTGKRGIPDVAFDADPSTGVSIDSVANGGWIVVGGTSLASPAWAGLVAIADQGRALNGLGTLDGATQILPDLYAAPAGSFNDITTGSRATAGYDTATGLGSPNAVPLIAALSGNSIPVTTPTNPSTPPTMTATPTTTTTVPTSTPPAPTPSPTAPAAPVRTSAPTQSVTTTPMKPIRQTSTSTSAFAHKVKISQHHPQAKSHHFTGHAIAQAVKQHYPVKPALVATRKHRSAVAHIVRGIVTSRHHLE